MDSCSHPSLLRWLDHGGSPGRGRERAWASGERRGTVGGELVEAAGRPAKDRGHVVSDVIGVPLRRTG